jgi:acetyltransferase
MINRLTRINYDSEVALVATEKGDESEQFIAIGRIMRAPDSSGAEFAIVVADSWQGKGVGAKLLEHCLQVASELGIDEVWGTILRENTKMLALGKKLGFSISSVPGTSLFELRKKLR